MHVVATAGHVDHGKSALVRALTGMEPDRWKEERRRGLTLDLGFAWTPVSGSGTDGQLAFVDVPGHERLVGNMLAGVGPVPLVLFVVAADQGWQQQSEEHLAVLNALSVRHGLLAVTRSDLADPGPVRKDALARLAETTLGTVPSVEVSAVTGAGLGELRAELEQSAGNLPAPDTAADVRLWVDRAFTVRGRGTVVTGTLAAGSLRIGDRLATSGGGEPLRVRGLQTLKSDRQEVGAVARVAVNVHGPGSDGLGRGDALLTPGRWLGVSVADVRLHGGAARDLPRHLTLHLGSAALPVVTRPLGDDTARLSWERRLPVRIGDRALLRDPGRHRIPAGITFLDVRPERLTRRGAAAARARTLASLDGTPSGSGELTRRKLIRRGELLAMGADAPAGPVAGDWLADPGHWRELRERLVSAVEDHSARHPADPGLPVEAARRALSLPERSLVHALASAEGERPLQHRDGRLYGSASRPALPQRAQAAADAVRRELEKSPFQPPDTDRLTQMGLTPRLQAAASAAGVLLRIADNVVLLPGADDQAVRILAGLEQPFTLSAARRALGTTRRIAVPLLEYLDAQHRTERIDGTLRRCRGSAPPQGPHR